MSRVRTLTVVGVLAFGLIAIAGPATAQCSGGQCPYRPAAEFRPAAQTRPPVAAVQNKTPVGDPPGPGFVWASLPGVGYGWVGPGVLELLAGK